MPGAPQVTVVVPSFNQGAYLADALASIAAQDVATEIIVMDGGSTDGSVKILEAWSERLAYWRSAPDSGQGAAINEGIARGRAPFVAWLNSDDLLEPGGLSALIDALEGAPHAPAAYGRVDDLEGQRRKSLWVEPFDEGRLALRNIVSQPGTLIRRSCWEAVGGVDPALFLAMDYDLWWRLFRRFGPLAYADRLVAVNRVHGATKTRNNRAAHYREAIAVVRRNHGRVPLKWWLYQPYAVWWKALAARLGR
jgi:glycosyltransferase involved in cell wall biosynthesis